ncbi:MAG: CTP synthase [Methanonatronarchaeales archaeon]|nr:CTP synthase [Methanonatronarchaeales archaeon]
MKYVFVTGGVMSGLGKGVTAASIGRILKSHGLDVTAVKVDPYLNIDPGTMSPYQHGEVYVLKDGSEVDLDLGNYERFLNVELTGDHNITTGKVYRSVIERERAGDYLGKTVQIIPHVTDEIKSEIRSAVEDEADVAIVEIGGTVGDIESMPYLEAIRQMRNELPPEDFLLVHVTLVPVLSVVGEQKTKPTQHSVSELRETGLAPDVIVGRCNARLEEETKEKIALFCDVTVEAVWSAHDVEEIYEVPLVLNEEGALEYLERRLDLSLDEDLSGWAEMVESVKGAEEELRVAVVGKYVQLEDSYHSIVESLKHAGAVCGASLEILWVDAERIEGTLSGEDEYDYEEILEEADGVLVPGGFGSRGSGGKIEAIRYARESGKPFLGLCLGFQLAVIEFARNVLGLDGAHSTELEPGTPEPVIDVLPEQAEVDDMGGTMRLGDQRTIVMPGSLANDLYGSSEVVERHRHRYEVNPRYIAQLEIAGMKFTGKDETARRMEILELEGHPFFVGTQYHPEFTSRPGKPNPVFLGFVSALGG